MGAISMAELSGPLSQAYSGAYRHGLGKAIPGTTILTGQADLEPGDAGFPGTYVQSTMPGTTSVARMHRAPPTRRIDLTREVEQLEFLTGTAGVHPRVLAQKLWGIRRKLMSSIDWPWASYADPGSRYDSREDLMDRVDAVERALGIEGMSFKMASALFGLGGLGQWGSSVWGQPWNDPIAKLASCIRGAMCVPGTYCCPPGTCYEPPLGDEFLDEELEELFDDPEFLEFLESLPPDPLPPDPLPSPGPGGGGAGAGAGAGAGGSGIAARLIPGAVTTTPVAKSAVATGGTMRVRTEARVAPPTMVITTPGTVASRGFPPAPKSVPTGDIQSRMRMQFAKSAPRGGFVLPGAAQQTGGGALLLPAGGGSVALAGLMGLGARRQIGGTVSALRTKMSECMNELRKSAARAARRR